MDFNEKDIKKISIIVLIAILAVLVFIAIKPVLFAIIFGLVGAYVCYPVFIKLNNKIKRPTLSASMILIFLIIIILVPLWFLTPLLIQQVFELFRASGSIDVQKFITLLFPTGSDQFVNQLTLTLNNLISRASSGILNFLISFFLEIPTIVINLFVGGFVFFYALKDSEALKKFVSELSPINKDKEKILVNQFKSITDSIVYGTFIVGIIQGIFTGLGLLIFGVDNALVLTILATFFSILPILGPYIIWVPITIFLFSVSSPGVALMYLAYNAIIVSSLDNILRSYIVAKKTDLSQAIVLIGMVGGILVFGIIGLLLGPLLLAYFITLLRSYKDKNLYSLFSEETKSSK